MSVIEQENNIRTNNWLYMCYLKHIRGHRLVTRWYRPRIHIGPISVYQVRYTLCPPQGAACA